MMRIRNQRASLKISLIYLTDDSNDNNEHASTHNSPILEPQTNTNSSTDTASEQEDLELEELNEDEPLSAIGRFNKGDKLQLTVDGTWNDVWIRGRDLKSGNPSKYRYSFDNQTAIYRSGHRNTQSCN